MQIIMNILCGLAVICMLLLVCIFAIINIVIIIEWGNGFAYGFSYKWTALPIISFIVLCYLLGKYLCKSPTS